jgi:hypothetical protein
MGIAMATVLLHRCLLKTATVVLTRSARTARRPSHHSSTRYHAQGRSHVIGVTLKVGHRCRSPTVISTHSDMAHSLDFNFLLIFFTFLIFFSLSFLVYFFFALE